jgi:HAMP domain-containing protein
MKLIFKINLVLILVFLAGLGGSYYYANELLQQNARAEIRENARIMMASAIAVRTYTVSQIKPLLDNQMRYKFLPQTVAAYSAVEYFNNLRKTFPDYLYKEATTNPTNLRDKADDWENDIISYFRANPSAKELIGERDGPAGRMLYLAQPLRITNPACLQCHSNVEAAPQTMLDTYGTKNGFNWQLNDVVTAQIVSVPYTLPLQRANSALTSFVYLLVGLFLFFFITVNILVVTLVLRRVRKLGEIADKVSMGDMDAPEFSARGHDEIAALGQSFNRMRRSLVEALNMLQSS